MAELIHGDPAAWDAQLRDVRRDIHHTAGFHEYARGSGEGEPYLIVVRDGNRGFAWPYLLRRVDELEGLAGSDATDVTSVYGYPGPLVWGDPEPDFIAAAWRDVLDVWRGQRAVAAFTRFNPVLGNAELLPHLHVPGDSPHATGDPSAGGSPTVSIDCTLPDSTAAEAYGRVLRQEIAAAHRAGLVTTHDEGWSSQGEFVRLYRETMERSGAAAWYYLDAADVDRLHDALGDGIHLLATKVDGAVAAAGLFTEFGGIVHAHLVGTEIRLRAFSPLKVLLDDARAWAHRRGNQILHLGGGRGGENDSLFAFKARFSPRRHAFYTGRWIVDPRRYQELVSAGNPGATGGSALGAGFFPAYRAPQVQVEG
jgi:Acetyltransferase (GNAT) domain